MTLNNHSKQSGQATPALLDRSRLVQRWQHGSDTFFWRQEKRGALVALSDGAKVRYRWEDVFAFEGGQPPEGLAEAYTSDLLTERQAAALCSVKPSFILAAARKGELPARRIGRAFRFVPALEFCWHKRRFVNRKSPKNRGKAQNE